MYSTVQYSAVQYNNPIILTSPLSYSIKSITMKLLIALLTLGSAAAFAPSTPAFNKVASATQLYGEYGASSTSFYTDVEKQETYDSLETVLEASCADLQVREVIKDMLGACADITEALRTALVTVEGSSNTFGDAQLSVDVSQSQHFIIWIWVRICSVHSLFVHYFIFIVHYFIFIVHYFIFVVHYFIFIVHYFIFNVHYFCSN